MGIFNEFDKKEKPVFTGSRFGFGSGGGGATSTATGFSATGGTKINASDGSTYHIFQYPNSENLVVTGSQTKPATVFLIAGGGGGGIQHAGGGGAGAGYTGTHDYGQIPAESGGGSRPDAGPFTGDLTNNFLSYGASLAFKSHHRDSTMLNHELRFDWIQLRTGENPIIRKERQYNKISIATNAYHKEVTVNGVTDTIMFRDLMKIAFNEINGRKIQKFHYTDIKKLKKKIKAIIKPGDYIFLKGSRSMNLEKIYN